MATQTISQNATAVAPTQELRDLIEEISSGTVDAQDLHNALLKLEMALGLPMTQPSDNEEDEL